MRVRLRTEHLAGSPGPALGRFAQRVAALVPPLVVAFVVALAFGPARVTSAESPAGFLTLPFESTENIHVQRGWWAFSRTLNHHAIDYIRGTVDEPATWEQFPVIAAAAGEACAQLAGKHGCVDIPDEKLTNRVLLRHVVDGTVYFTVYQDLATIAPGIPIGSDGATVPLERGAPIGVTGEDPDLIHLHFEVLDADRQPIDPYGIEGGRAEYPDPADANPIAAPPGYLWVANPPRPPIPSEMPSASRSAPPPTATDRPSVSAAPIGTPTAQAVGPIGDEGTGSSGSAGAPLVPLIVVALVALLGSGLAFEVARRRRGRSGREA